MDNNRTTRQGSIKEVQKFNEDFELLGKLPPTGLKILKILGAHGVAAEAQRMLGCVKSNVSYWKDKFIKAGALRLQCDGITKYYELTEYGSKILGGVDNGLPILFEDRPVKFRVLRREQCRVDWEKLGSPRNWRQLGVRLGEVQVMLHDRLGVEHDEANVIVHPGQVKGFTSSEVFADSVRIVERTRGILEVKFGMLLDEVGEVIGKPRYHVYRPECHAWIEAGNVEVDGVGSLDASGTHDKQDPLNGRPHVEYYDGKLADVAASFPVIKRGAGLGESAVEFPLVLRKLLETNRDLTHKVDNLSTQFEALATSEKGVSESLSNLVSLIKGESVPEKLHENSVGGSSEYVR